MRFNAKNLHLAPNSIRDIPSAEIKRKYNLNKYPIISVLRLDSVIMLGSLADHVFIPNHTTEANVQKEIDLRLGKAAEAKALARDQILNQNNSRRDRLDVPRFDP